MKINIGLIITFIWIVSCTKNKQLEQIQVNQPTQKVITKNNDEDIKKIKNPLDNKKIEEQQVALLKIEKERDCMYKIYLAIDKPENTNIKKSLCRKQYNNDTCHSIKSELLEELKPKFCKN